MLHCDNKAQFNVALGFINSLMVKLLYINYKNNI